VQTAVRNAALKINAIGTPSRPLAVCPTVLVELLTQFGTLLLGELPSGRGARRSLDFDGLLTRLRDLLSLGLLSLRIAPRRHSQRGNDEVLLHGID
jgi:hypothetical protein